ncbi:MAG TPA: oxygen-independent coproporphyrinogen III oxidase [Dongiaceae bacterium]|nr:oxygen-independent coproporphyrinogen III oxidase [Dongiaceae bacterium]
MTIIAEKEDAGRRLLLKHDRPVPRYTSYPTAPHFHPGIGAADAARWMGEADPQAPISLYLHVPYCRQMCWYCGCHTKIVARYQPVADFVARLCDEIALVARRLGQGRRLGQVHWGGGTPNMVAADDIRRIHDSLAAHFAIDAASEHAMELDPRAIAPELRRALQDCGVKRVSLGIQDFDAEVQSAINREQPFALVEEQVAALRIAGIRSINLDLIYGLPRQTRAGFARSVELALALEPERFAIFGYAHVPWMKKHQRLIDDAVLPDATLRLELARDAAAIIEGAGYRRIGLDHFALPADPLALALDGGTLRRNFQGYTTDRAETLIGLGPSAISAFAQGYAQNAADIPLWGRAIGEGRLATQRGLALDAEDRWRRAAIERLMCFGTLDVASLAAEFRLPDTRLAAERARLAPLVADGIVEWHGSRLRVTPSGEPLIRVVAAAFDAYLNAGPGRHSRAV